MESSFGNHICNDKDQVAVALKTSAALDNVYEPTAALRC